MHANISLNFLLLMKFVGEVDTSHEPKRLIYSTSELTALALYKISSKNRARQIRNFSHQKK